MSQITPGETQMIRITALGACGDGKSTVLNRIYGDTSEKGNQYPNTTGLSSDSVTKYINATPGKFNYHVNTLQKYNNKSFEIIDTIGLSDPKMSNSEITEKMMDWFKNSCKGINVFLLVFNVTNVRYAAHIQNTLLVLNHLFGKEFWKHVMIVFARCDMFFGRKINTDEFAAASEQYPKLMIEQFKLNHTLPVVGMGKGNYVDGINQILQYAMQKGTFVCDNMKAYQEAVKKNKENEEIKKLKDEIRSLKSQFMAPKQNERSIWGELMNGLGTGIGMGLTQTCIVM